jgi:hypothetical protein
VFKRAPLRAVRRVASEAANDAGSAEAAPVDPVVVEAPAEAAPESQE